MRRSVFLVALILLCLSFQLEQPSHAAHLEPANVSSIEKPILAAEADRTNALRSGDVEALKAIYTDDLVYTNAQGTVLTKEQHLDDVKNRKLTFLSFGHSDVKVRMHGDTAILTGLSTSSVKYGDHVSSGARRFTNVYVKQNGRWRCAVHFETPVPAK